MLMVTTDMDLAPGEVWSAFDCIWLTDDGNPLFAGAGRYRLRARIRHNDKNVYSDWVEVNAKALDDDVWRFLRRDATVAMIDQYIRAPLGFLSGNPALEKHEQALRDLQKVAGSTCIAEIVRRKIHGANLIKRLKDGLRVSWSEWLEVVATKDANLREWLLREIGSASFDRELKLSPDEQYTLLENVVKELGERDEYLVSFQSSLARQKAKLIGVGVQPNDPQR